MRIVQRAVRGDAHISQNLYALMIGVPIGNGPGRFAHFRQMIKKSPDLLLHPIGHEVHVQINDTGDPQRLQVSGDGIVCQRRCDQWKLLYTKICECRHHSSDRVHSIMQWGTPVTVLPYQILALCWTRGDCNTYCNTDPDYTAKQSGTLRIHYFVNILRYCSELVTTKLNDDDVFVVRASEKQNLC